MAEEKNEVVEKKEQPKTFSVVLADKLNEVSDALPSDFNKARFIQNSLALINDNPQLQSFKSTQIMAGLLKGSYLGTDFFSKEAWLIPYKGDLQFQISYKGAQKLAKKYSTRPILDIYAKVVRAGDEFDEKIVDGRPSLDFHPLPFNSGAIIGAFAVALFVDGGIMYETMSIAEIENTRKRASKSGNVWESYYEEMCKKTVIKRLTKNIDIDFENPTMRKTYDEDGAIDTAKVEYETTNPVADEFIDTTAEVVEQ